MSRSISLMLAATLLGGCAHADKIANLQSQVADRDNQIAALRADNQGYVIETSTLRDELTRLDARDKELTAWYDDVVGDLGPSLDKGDVELVLYKDRSVLELPESAYFDSGSATLTPAGKDAVHHLADLAKSHPDRRFQVEGHTDSRPIATAQYPDNWALGSARAVTVVRELVGMGVPASQLSAASYADTSPLASNDGPVGQATNRRIAVAMMPTPGESGEHLALYERAKKDGHVVAAVDVMVQPTTAVASSP